MKEEDALAEVEDCLRNAPDIGSFAHPSMDTLAWLGRVAAVAEAWKVASRLIFSPIQDRLLNPHPVFRQRGYQELMILLHQVRSDRRLKTVGPLNVAVGTGMVFEYFDSLRKLVEIAKQDILFVDPYLDADFVSRYIPFVASGVTVRLLGREKMSGLVAAVDAFTKQQGTTISVRSISGQHDRYVFIDGAECYQSGASFKDGAKNALTTLTQITDAFGPVKVHYEGLWAAAKVER